MDKKEKRNLKIAIVINIIIGAFTIIASIIMFTGFEFMSGEKILETSKIGMFKFFTVDSNILMGIVALVFAKKEIDLLNGKIEKINLKDFILKLLATSGVGLTFLVVFGYLGPITEGGIPMMLKNSNLFFHLLIPVLSMINFVFFEKTSNLELKHVIWGALPEIIYSCCYLINVLLHSENGKVSPYYDWYWLVQGGIWQIVIVAPLMFVVSYVISFCLWKLNNIFNRKTNI